MGRSLADHRPDAGIMAPTAIKYTMGRKLAVHADVLAGMGIRAVGRRHGISHATVINIMNDPLINEIQNPIVVEKRKEAMANHYDYNADRSLSTIDQAKLNSMNAYQLTMIAAISTDKSRLLRDQSTENFSVRGVADHIQKELLEIRSARAKLVEALGGETGVIHRQDENK